MSRHGHLAHRRENAHTGVGIRPLRGQDERAFGKIHLARQPLHLSRVQSARISENRELVAEQRFACEHIVVKV
jgi:hypothetical protein